MARTKLSQKVKRFVRGIFMRPVIGDCPRRLLLSIGILSSRHHCRVQSFFVVAGPSCPSNFRQSMSTSTATDPYLWLEEVESPESLAFAKAANEACLEALGHPEKSGTGTYDRILRVLESDDRIPDATVHGVDGNDETILYNFWKDAKNPKGLWRKTTLGSYKTATPAWDTVLNVDELGGKDGVSWVWKGSQGLPRGRDPINGKLVTRTLLSLSRGGSDAIHVKEFDLVNGDFVMDKPFCLPEAKTRAAYKSRDVLIVGTDFGPDSLTNSGYPRTVREWVRGTDLAEAPVVFEGEKTDVSVVAYIADERIWQGGIYEVRGRSLTFYTSKYWMRKIQFEHLLAPDDPLRANVDEPPDFVQVDIQEDASIDLLGSLLIVTLRSDWEPVPGGLTYVRGSVVMVSVDDFLANGAANCEYQVLFTPTERTAYEYYTCTKNYFILSTMDNVKSKLDFYRIDWDDSTASTSLTRVGGDLAPQIRDCSCRPLDPYSGSDQFWFSTSNFVTPTTLCLADAALVNDGDETGEDAFVTERVKSLPPQFDATGCVALQKFTTSKDGTEIPYFIVMKEETVFDGKNPTLLYGYGGFEISLGPHYVATAGLAWLERGGVYVEANIRGGGEFGPSWHQAALKEKRHKAYEDFIAVAEDLIAQNICQPKTLAIRGGSNGGLLMGNMFTMRPDLFGAIHCAVPLLDMQRYHTLLAGASWMAEYGDPDTDDWKFLEKYSPYHNIEATVDYPPILVTTSTRDDRVHPGHARKFVKDTDNNRQSVYYYENIEGGHGGAADAKQSAFMLALAYDFMFDTLSKSAKAL